MNYVRHSDGTITYYDNQGRPIRGDMSRQSPDYYIKSDGTRVNGPFDFTEPKTLTYADPMGNVRQYQYKENSYLPMSEAHPAHLVPGLSHINGKSLNISQDYVKHSDGTVENYPRNMQWPAVSGLGDPRRPNGVYMEPSPSSEVPVSLPPSGNDSEAKKAFLVEHSAARLKSIPYSSKVPASPALSDEDIIRGIFRNEYGTGDERKNKLLNLGLSLEDIGRIQGLVNARMYAAQAKPVKRGKSVSVPVSTTPRQERVTYQGMPMNWVDPQDPDYIYVR